MRAPRPVIGFRPAMATLILDCSNPLSFTRLSISDAQTLFVFWAAQVSCWQLLLG